MSGPEATTENVPFHVLLPTLKTFFELAEAERPPGWMHQIESLNTLLNGLKKQVP